MKKLRYLKRRVLLWLCFHVRLGRLAPWVMGLAIGSKLERVGK